MKLSITEGGKEGKNIAITPSKYLEEKLQDCSRKEGSALETTVGTLGADLGTRTKQLGAKEKARRKQCYVRFSLIRNNQIIQKNFMRIGGEKAIENGFGSRESVEKTSRGHRAHRKG